MKKMDTIGLKLCSYQAALFESSVSGISCSSKIFIRRFMYSDLARRMDDKGFMFDSLSIEGAVDELEAQYGTSTYGLTRFSSEEMHWIGYIYRYWAYTDEMSSKQLYRMIKPDHLRKMYLPYHTLDPLAAIERIKEDLPAEWQGSTDDIARGVRVLRAVRQRLA